MREPVRIIPVLLVLAAISCSQPGSTVATAPGGAAPTHPAQAGSLTPGPAAGIPVAIPEHRIAIRTVNGASEFFDRQTGATFMPRGAALWRWRWHDQTHQSVIDVIFNTSPFGQLDSALEELPKMRSDGFNTVRLWFNACWGGATGCLDNTGGGLNRGFLLNMARFLQAAKDNGIYVILTMDSLPDSYQYQGLLVPWRKQFDGFNLEYMTQGGVDAQAKYQTDLIRGLIEVGAPMDAILAYQIKEEAYFETNLAPFSTGSGDVTPANGRTYSLTDPAQRRALMEDSWLYYIEQVTRAIKAVDPTALVTMGFFLQQEPNTWNVGDPRLVYLHKVLYESALDYISFSSYPEYGLTMKQQAENFDLIGYNEKPVVMGEFGADKRTYADIDSAATALQAWQAASCEYGFDGWQMWYWGGGDIHFEYWEALEGNGEVRRALSPALHPDPCAVANLALNKPVQVSAALPDAGGALAVDGNPDSSWNSGLSAPQWIQIDLGQPTRISKIRLRISQYPAGPSTHQVLLGTDVGQLALAHEFVGPTTDPGVLEFSPATPLVGIRYVKILTLASPSWVAWREIEILAP